MLGALIGNALWSAEVANPFWMWGHAAPGKF